MMNKYLFLSATVVFFKLMSINGALASSNSTAPSPTTACQKCHKEVAVFYQECAKTVTSSGIVKNQDGLKKCKEYAKDRKEKCKKVCSE